MKRSIIALILCLTLVCALIAPAAAESGYLILQATLGLEEYGGDLYLGDAYLYDVDEANRTYLIDGKWIVLEVDLVNGCVALSGLDADGVPQQTAWMEVEDTKCLYLIYCLCGLWEDLNALPDEGYHFMLAVYDGEGEGDTMYIYDAATAAMVLNAFTGLMGGGEAPQGGEGVSVPEN
ncbi:MAG: hypothetical protein CW338_01730 [Clostridiales bacterium]|nr:hypothetical protein [Clostridiales bacterium]